jgi:hypothetical protein
LFLQQRSSASGNNTLLRATTPLLRPSPCFGQPTCFGRLRWATATWNDRLDNWTTPTTTNRKCHNNLAAVHVKGREWQLARKHATGALKCDKLNGKVGTPFVL